MSGNGLAGTSAVTYSYDARGRPMSVTDNNDNRQVDWTYTRENDGGLRVEEIHLEEWRPREPALPPASSSACAA